MLQFCPVLHLESRSGFASCLDNAVVGTSVDLKLASRVELSCKAVILLRRVFLWQVKEQLSSVGGIAFLLLHPNTIALSCVLTCEEGLT